MPPVEYVPRLTTDFIAVHCAATPPDADIGAAEIRKWHMAPPLSWDDIGYHLVIRRNGLVEAGRPLDAAGSHVKGFNSRALGVCLVGGVDDAGKAADNFMPSQMRSLLDTLRFLRRYAPGARIQGHRDFPDVKKDCPSFDVRQWLQVMAPELL